MADDAPLLSVCIPNYNMGGWISTAIDSALALTPADDVEVVVFDNASSDGSLATVETYAHCNRLILEASSEHVPMAENWNRCIRRSSGRWCLVLSADDEVAPGYWEAVRNDALSGRFGLVSAYADVVDAQGVTIGRQGPAHRSTFDLSRLSKAVVEGNPFPLLTTIFPRWGFDRIGGFDGSRSGPLADLQFWLRLLTAIELPALAVGIQGGVYHHARGSTWSALASSGAYVGYYIEALEPLLAAVTRRHAWRLRRQFGEKRVTEALRHLERGKDEQAQRLLAAIAQHGRGGPRLVAAIGHVAVSRGGAGVFLAVLHGGRRIRGLVRLRSRWASFRRR